MTVAELILWLQKQPQDLLVAYNIYSESCLLDTKDITIEELAAPREDGWVAYPRGNAPRKMYLMFPGN